MAFWLQNIVGFFMFLLSLNCLFINVTRNTQYSIYCYAARPQQAHVMCFFPLFWLSGDVLVSVHTLAMLECRVTFFRCSGPSPSGIQTSSAATISSTTAIVAVHHTNFMLAALLAKGFEFSLCWRCVTILLSLEQYITPSLQHKIRMCRFQAWKSRNWRFKFKELV